MVANMRPEKDHKLVNYRTHRVPLSTVSSALQVPRPSFLTSINIHLQFINRHL